MRTTTTVLVLLAWASSASAAYTFTFQEGVSAYTGTTDTQIDGTIGNQTANSGSSTTLHVYDREVNPSGQPNPADDLRVARSLIRFDLSSLQPELGTKTVSSVTLTITSLAYAFGTKGLPNSLHRMAPANAAWTEAQATWERLDQAGATPWASGLEGLVAGTDYIATALDTQNSPNPGGAGPANGDTITFTLNDVSFFAGWINNPSTNAGFVIRQPGPNSGGFDRFYSSEVTLPDAPITFRPLLTVTMVPEPASMALLATGPLFLLARRRSRC